eukprot:COSAG01_NODE_5136_length_4460_cov_2.629901_4_plen_92_part_00
MSSRLEATMVRAATDLPDEDDAHQLNRATRTCVTQSNDHQRSQPGSASQAGARLAVRDDPAPRRRVARHHGAQRRPREEHGGDAGHLPPHM